MLTFLEVATLVMLVAIIGLVVERIRIERRKTEVLTELRQRATGKSLTFHRDGV